MRKILPVVLCLLTMAAVLSAQDYKGKGRIVGTVYDDSGKPIEGVKVKLYLDRAKGGYETVTDKDGRWTGAFMSSGSWVISFQKSGYDGREYSIDIAEQRKNPDMIVNMKKVEGALTEDLRADLVSANALFEQKNYAGALEAFQGLAAKNPDVFIIWRFVGNCYFAQDQYDKAEEAYMKVLDKDAKNVDAIVSIGNCYANRKQDDKALEWYNKVEFGQIKDPTVLYNIGSKYFNMGKSEDSLKYYLRSIEVQDGFLDGIYQAGVVYTSLQKTVEAIALFERYLKLDPDSPRAGQVKGFLDYLRKK